jgi:calcineurin-like phosphoesterase family protein
MSFFIISDPHFGHANIIKYCARPFKDTAEMDKAIVANWNQVVRPDDTVLCLGDVFWVKKDAYHLSEQLNGRKQVILGNHDPGVDFFKKINWTPLTTKRNERFYLYNDHTEVIMAHRPRDLPTFEETRYNGNRVVLCGHEHTNAPIFIMWVRDKGDQARPIMALNMSCEYWNYTPVLLETAIQRYRREIQKHLNKAG